MIFGDIIGPSKSEKKKELDGIIDSIDCPSCKSSNLNQDGLTIQSKKNFTHKRVHCNDCKGTFFIIWNSDLSKVYIEKDNKIIPVKGRT
jgi:transposase-like protein